VTDVLHVTNGDSTAGTLRATSLGGAVLPWRDTLHEGPVPAVSRPELLRARAAFLSTCGWGSRDAIFSSLERRDLALTDALQAGTQVVLWLEHDLYDQLQLLDVLTLVRAVSGEIELIVVGSFPGRPGFHGLGELSTTELESLWPGRTHATAEALDAAGAAWDAVRRPDPTAIASFAEAGVPALPFLAAALRRLLEELPWVTDGLSGTERHALSAIATGDHTAHSAFAASQESEDAPFLGDTWFHRTLAALGHGPNRLIETADGDPLPAPPPRGDSTHFARQALRVTDPGARVLSGEADKVELLGVERWIGGAHVTPATAWRWDATAQRVVAPAEPKPARVRHPT
jgi:hypothetical protein